MLRRVAFVGACYLSLHHTAYFCCAAAAWVCSSSQLFVRAILDGNTGTVGIAIRYYQSLHSSPQRQFFHAHQFLRRFLAYVTDDKTPNKMREARCRVYDPAAQQQQQQQRQQAGPCARAISSPYVLRIPQTISKFLT